MLRRVAVLAASLMMAASVGLAGAGSAFAASPALHIKFGSKWTFVIERGTTSNECEVLTFHAIPQDFSADRGGDAGMWSGGGESISLGWTAGVSNNQSFRGIFSKTSSGEKFKGMVNTPTGGELPAHLLNKVLARC
jgi:hypothetical protein